MKKRTLNFGVCVFAALLFLAPAISFAEDSPPPLAEIWMMVPKIGHGSELGKALSKHMAYRTEQADPRSRQAYSPMLGDELTRIGVRFCCFNWADLDSYREWSESNSQVSEHFREHVIPHVEKWEHYFESIDWKSSNWSEKNAPYKFFAVTEYNIKPGHGADFGEARDKIIQIAINQGWANDDRPWLWSKTIGGKPQESIVIPHANFASMDRGDESFFRFLAEQMGSEEAAASLMKQFEGSVWSSEFQIWEHQEDFSMSDDD